MILSYPSYPIFSLPIFFADWLRVTFSKNFLPYLTLSYPFLFLNRVRRVRTKKASYPAGSPVIIGLGKKVRRKQVFKLFFAEKNDVNTLRKISISRIFCVCYLIKYSIILINYLFI